MPKKMLIDATHPEETRVVVVDGNKVEEFDFESLNKRQLAGNIYLAKVTRVEPSLQAAFVDYGGNRHGFLAFSEIHPDYYQIPVADREALLAEEKVHATADAAEEDQPRPRRRSRRRRSAAESTPPDALKTADTSAPAADDTPEPPAAIPGMDVVDLDTSEAPVEPIIGFTQDSAPQDSARRAAEANTVVETDAETEVETPAETAERSPTPAAAATDSDSTARRASQAEGGEAPETATTGGNEAVDAEIIDDEDDEDSLPDPAEVDPNIESVADDDDHEDIRPRRKPRPRRYKIQEVIKVRQILLVQVVKEERGNKGAALTTYLSLAGRYCVLMPNTARGGGISRKITNAADRKRLKQIAAEIDIPEGAGLIIRTAGAKRTKAEIKRDYEFLLRQWEQVRDLTLKSIAPAPIYEEGSLIKRSIRDLYDRDIEEILIEGEQGYRVAKDYMKMLMPSHAKNVKQYTDPMPLFARYQVESYLSGMFNPVVQLKSGGYIVIGVTEALVAIDVNSGRSTKEGSIEDTALKTNLEAAEEVARQLRLRDLAGLIVIDFIDMEDRRNNAAVEKRIKERLKSDRARIQVGRISGFGLMEMSRQRLRPGMIEATTRPCPHCHGTGLTRSDDSLALSILREIEEEGVRQRTREVLVTVPVGIANFILNQKRAHVAAIEKRYGMVVRIEASPLLISPDYTIERFRTSTRQLPEPSVKVVSMESAMIDTPASAVDEPPVETGDDSAPKKKRRRRRRRGGRGRSGENGQEQPRNGDNAPEPREDEETAQETGKDNQGTTRAPTAAGKAAAEASAPEPSGTDGATPDGAVPDTPPEDDAARPARRKRRTTRRAADKAAARAPAGDAPVAQDTPVAEPVAEEGSPASDATTDKAVDSVSEGDEKPKPRKRRSRKKPASPPEASTDPQAAPDSTGEPPQPETAAPADPAEVDAPAAPRTPDEPPAETPAAPEPGPAVEPVTVTEPAAEEEPEAEKKPRRRGWWSQAR